MNLENQVTSLELSKRLKELGIPQRSLFFWVKVGLNVMTGEENWQPELLQYNLENIPPYYISAFTTGELLNLLPHRINDFSLEIINIPLIIGDPRHADFIFPYSIRYRTTHLSIKDENYKFLHEEYKDMNLSNSLSKMLLYLVENKHIEISK